MYDQLARYKMIEIINDVICSTVSGYHLSVNSWEVATAAVDAFSSEMLVCLLDERGVFGTRGDT